MSQRQVNSGLRNSAVETTRSKDANAYDESGFSLIELTVAMSVMLVVTGIVLSFMRGSLGMVNLTYELNEAQQSLRVTREYINRDATNVGDKLQSLNNIQLPVEFAMTYLSSRSRSVLDPDGDGYIDLGIITSDDNVPGTQVVAGTTPSVNVRNNTDRITFVTVDYGFEPVSLPPGSITPSGSNVSITPPDISRFQIGEIYYITSGTQATFGTITNITGANGSNPNLIFADGDEYGLNHPGNGGPINVVSDRGTKACSMMRIMLVHYFVSTEGLFIRRVFGVGGAGFRDSIIAEHVANLQFRYLLDLRDGSGNLAAPVRMLSTPEQQAAVRMVESSATVETVHPVANGKRQIVSSTNNAAIRNMQFNPLQP